MNKRIYRYFGGFLEKQGRFLNEMSAKGYRLVKTGELLYEFESVLQENMSIVLNL